MKQRPNILFIMTDQQRYDCLGVNGNAAIHTPQLDAFAAQSANFTSFFIQAPVCVPSRQTFFTGRYPHSHKNRVNYTPLNDSETLIQAYLQKAGYITGCIGKLHYSPPTNAFARSTGFDVVELHDGAHTNEHSDYVKWLRVTAPEYADTFRKVEPLPGTNPFRTRIPDEFHETTWCGLRTRNLLQQFAEADRPFFLFSSYWKPHSPFELPDPWAQAYNKVEFSIPFHVFQPDIPSKPLPLQHRMSEEDWNEGKVERLQWEYRSYYGAISQIDREVGETLALLKELGLEQNTIVVFCSDHGDMLREHGVKGGKNVFYESAIHVPLLIRYPGMIEAGVYHDLTESTDLLSTLFELCGLEVPYGNQGQSFARLFSGGELGSQYIPRDYVFAENLIPEINTGKVRNNAFVKGKGVAGIRHPDAKMVRSREWKYVYYVDHGEELYHLLEDPTEMNNLASDPACQEQLRTMKGALLDWLITSDETDQIAPEWNYYDEEGVQIQI